MEKENLKTKKITKTKTTKKPDLPPPPPLKTQKAKSSTKTTKKSTDVQNLETQANPKIFETLNPNIVTKEKTSKVDFYDVDLTNDFKKKKDLPVWAYCVFVPLIFCMLLFIIVFAIGAAAYAG